MRESAAASGGQQQAVAVTPPPVNRFPVCPASWYLFCHANDLRRGPFSKTMFGRRLVAYRPAQGDVSILDARCAHLGADLGRGRVIGASLQCPFHNWEYGPDGRCTRIPTTTAIPAFARQMCYPVAERHGFVFFFNGREPLFPLPFFTDERPEDFVAGKPFRFVANCTWYMLAANGFDAEHFRAVHDRTLIGPPEIDCPANYARRMRYTARVTGNSVFDRLLRHCAGRLVHVSITSWGGPFILVTGFFQRARSYILIATQPLEDGRTLIETVVLARRRRPALLRPLSLWVRRLFTRGFLRDDIDRLGSIRYNPHTLLANDRPLIEYFAWAAALPDFGPERTREGNGRDEKATCRSINHVPY
jgi:aminopyrrolnitrin oxygenase